VDRAPHFFGRRRHVDMSDAEWRSDRLERRRPFHRDQWFESVFLQQRVSVSRKFGLPRREAGMAFSIISALFDRVRTGKGRRLAQREEPRSWPGHTIEGRSSAREQAALIGPVERQIEFGETRRR
jgi:hypothetical protein